MNVYDATHNGVRYSIWALRPTDSDFDASINWTDDRDEALNKADCFRAAFNAAPPEDPENWEAVGDYYDTFDAAMEAVKQHVVDYLDESIDEHENASALRAYYARRNGA